MKLLHAPASPYVRKVMVLIEETGLSDRVEIATVTTTPAVPDADVSKANPVRKIPALIADDGMALFDSPVICEYLDSQHAGAKMFPAAGPSRWQALRLQAAADGLLDAALMVIYEGRIRPEELHYQPWLDAQTGKIDGALDAMEEWSGGFGDRVDIGTISVACALGYLDFRFPNKDWRADHSGLAAWYAGFAARKSMQATQPVG